MKKTPLQIVKEKYDDKGKLISELAGKLETKEDESKGDITSRLAKVSSKKLLNLLNRVEEADKFGGRNGMIDAIHDYKVKLNAKKSDVKEDKTLKEHLNKQTLGALLSEYKGIKNKIK